MSEAPSDKQSMAYLARKGSYEFRNGRWREWSMSL